MLHFCCGVLVIMMLLLLKWRRPRNFPPGPRALPILGNLLQLDYRNPMADLEKMAKQYGNVYSIYLGSSPVVILHGYKTVKNALVDHAAEFADRPDDPIFYAISKNKGIGLSPYNQQWKDQKRFSLTVLKNFGMGKTSMESRIQEELKHLIKYYGDIKGCSFQPQAMLRHSVTNVMCSILFGRHYDYSEEEFNRLLQLVVYLIKDIGGTWGELYRAFPVIRYFPLPSQRIFTIISKLHTFLKEIIEEHRMTMKPDEPRDYIDCYLDAMNKKQNNGLSFDDEGLLAIVIELFLAAVESTAASLDWLLLCMMAYPDIQENCSEEIKLVIDEQKEITYNDRHRMPYVRAVIHEIMRFAAVAPLGLPRGIVKETSFNGYTLPKGLRVFLNLQSVLHDESQWKFPHEFNPKNFLNDSGEFVKPDAFLPFSAGPRVCIGESLHQMLIFLFFTTLLQHFEIASPENNKRPDFTALFGITQSPVPYKVSLKCRRC